MATTQARCDGFGVSRSMPRLSERSKRTSSRQTKPSSRIDAAPQSSYFKLKTLAKWFHYPQNVTIPRSHPGTSSMYPGLHDDVQTRLESNGLKFNFRKNGDKKNHTNSYDSHIMGRFTCANKNCIADGWTSKKIAVTIRQFPGNEYNAEVYHQRCLKCNWLSKPKLDDSYADRVAYRLKKWSGMHVEPRPFSGVSKGPHYRHLCEGCKAGHCDEGSDFLF
ncbi:hypothetical protein BB8028_0010g00400 [Beauveria bassiana]|uniref:3CxxC-type domain-containing protein n=1 Tax=Beauveria bassiana TaxID=176275 RepID=A0A2S7YPD8_BEABA|nr:hypothetical protein BB8028_0010g00400 [Beauveria bassiana]